MQDGVPFGKYLLIKRLAAGGMAEVFLARPRDGMGPQHVAIKRLLPALSADVEFLEMFVDEMRVAALFRHPYVVQVYDFGRVDDLLYLAMEYVHGVNLDQVGQALRLLQGRGPLPWPIASRMAIYLCEALQYAHELAGPDGTALGLVHRDVNPKNVMIAYSGALKLVDFGIARVAARCRTTLPGLVKATLEYAAPEQYSGQPVDARTDFYGLGLTLYELLSGSQPFRRDAPDDMIRAVLHEEPPALRRADLPRALSRLVHACLAKDPARRPASAREIRVALEDCLARAHEHVGLPEIAAFVRSLFAGEGRVTFATAASLGDPTTTGAGTEPL